MWRQKEKVEVWEVFLWALPGVPNIGLAATAFPNLATVWNCRPWGASWSWVCPKDRASRCPFGQGIPNTLEEERLVLPSSIKQLLPLTVPHGEEMGELPQNIVHPQKDLTSFGRPWVAALCRHCQVLVDKLRHFLWSFGLWKLVCCHPPETQGWSGGPVGKHLQPLDSPPLDFLHTWGLIIIIEGTQQKISEWEIWGH